MTGVKVFFAGATYGYKVRPAGLNGVWLNGVRSNFGKFNRPKLDLTPLSLTPLSHGHKGGRLHHGIG